MDLPKAVAAQADEADALEKQLSGEPDKAPASETAKAEGTVDNSGSPEKWEAKYKTLEGMYKADGQRYRQQNKELEDKLASMEQELAEFRRQKEFAERTPLISDADRDQFGDDMITMVKRAAEDTLAEKGQELLGKYRDPEIERLKRELEESKKAAADQAEKAFFDHLSEIIPDWRVQNEDKGFLEWLSEPDEFSGIPRQQILDRACSIHDAGMAANVFNTYRQVRQQRMQTSPLSKQIAPTRSVGTVQTTSQAGGRIFTQAEIERFYNDVIQGKYTQEDAAKLEEEIDRAATEGRIR